MSYGDGPPPDPDVSRRLLDAIEAAVADPDLTVAEARLLLRDVESGIEELRIAEEELKVQGEHLASSQATIDAERVRYGELFEFAPDPYVVSDELGKVLEANTPLA